MQITDIRIRKMEKESKMKAVVSVTFDDGVTQDRQTNINEGVMLVGAGLLSKYTFLTDKKYGQGLTPEEAEAELKRIAAEQQSNAVEVTRLFGGME